MEKKPYVWIYLLMAFGIMLLDVLKLCGFIESWHIPIQIPEPFVKHRIPRANVANIAFEVLYIYRIESSDGSVETNVGFGDMLAKVIGGRVLGQMGFSSIK